MRLPRRLVAGLIGVAMIGASVLVGPALLGAGAFADPQNARLVSPGARLITLGLNDGRRLTGLRVEHVGSKIVLHGVSGPVEVASSSVATTTPARAWLGTDRYGRDLLRLILRGGRISVLIAVLGAVVALIVGVGVGLAAATLGRWADMLLMRSVDALLAFPTMLLLILAAAVFDPGPVTLVLLLGLTSWMGLARLVRGQVLSIRERPFVLAARVAGTPWYRMWTWHYLTGVRSPVAQDVALRLGDLVLAEATLSFLGLGLPVTMPTWGYLVSEGHRVMLDAWWLATFPGLAIASLVISCALVGDGIQEL